MPDLFLSYHEMEPLEHETSQMSPAEAIENRKRRRQRLKKSPEMSLADKIKTDKFTSNNREVSE